MTDRRLLDKDWRIAHLYKIRNKQGELVTFTRNRAQEHFANHRHTRNILIKSRQLGFTTDEALDMLDETLFTRNYQGLFIAQDLDTAKDIFDNKAGIAWKNFPLRDLYKLNTESARQMKLDFGDGTISSFTVDSSGRSGTYNRLHISEFAYVCKHYPDKAREILQGSIPAIPLQGRVDIETTVLESEGIIYDMFWDAWNRGEPTNPSQFKAHFYNWQWDDAELALISDADIKTFLASKDFDLFDSYQRKHKLTDRELTYYYFKWLSLNKDWGAMKKEYPTTVHEAFEGSGNKLFDINKIALMNVIEGERAGDWTYYKNARPDHRYVLAADVAEGVGQDSSTGVIWDFTPIKPEVVAIYKNNRITPDLFAHELVAGAKRYYMAMIAPERNNHGHATISRLKQIYPEELIYKDDKDRWGWETNLTTKPKMMVELSTAINNELVDIPSVPIQNEARRYDKENLNTARFDEDATQHWDLLIACAIGFQMKDYVTENNKVAHVTYEE